MDNLTIAIAKGRIEKDIYRRLEALNMEKWIDRDSRKLIFTDEENHITYIHVKPSDVVTYVEKGVADLGFGKCKFSVAGMKGKKDKYLTSENLKVATKYPVIAKNFFKSRGQKIDIIKLNGSVELGPIVGLSDVIVDLVETGNTIKANGLEVYEDLFDISARIIANRVSYKFNYDKIQKIIDLFDSTVKASDYK